MTTLITTSTRLRSFTSAGLLALAGAVGQIVGAAGSAQAAGTTLPRSPGSEVLIVDANLQEAFDPKDLADMSELRNFVRRLVDQVPYAPDVLLLQEVSHKSASYVARLLTHKLGRYVVAVDPGDDVWRQTETRIYKRDTAIVLNAATMSKIGSGGFIRTGYKAEDAAGGRKPETKENAFALVRETGGLDLAVATVHLPEDQLKTQALADTYKGWWSRKIADVLAKRFTGSSPNDIDVIAGDFNSPRCSNPEARDCDEKPFYSALTGALGYVDTLFHVIRSKGKAQEEGGLGRVDYTFATGSVIDASSDFTYTKEVRSDPAHFYSDHRFFWSIVGSAPRG